MTRRFYIASVAAGWSAVGILLGLLLWYTWQGPDIFFHLFLGRHVLATGSVHGPDNLLLHQPLYRNIYWFFQAVVYGAWSLGGVHAVTLLFMLVWGAVVGLWVRATGLHRRPAVGIPLTLVTVLVFQTRFEPRPESFSYLLLILQIGWLTTWRWGETAPDRRPGRLRSRLFLFAVTEAFWVNIHAYFVLGPALVGARLLAAVVDREAARTLRDLSALLLVTAVATLASPFGLDAWRLVGTFWIFLREMRGAITEFGPATGALLRLWTVQLFWVAWGATLLATIGLSVSRRGGLYPYLLAGAGLYLSAIGIRNLPLLPLLASPLWRLALEEAHAKGDARIARRVVRTTPAVQHAGRVALGSVLGTATLASLLSLSVVTGAFHRSLRSETTFGVGLPPHAYPERAARYLERHGARGRLLNSAADGGYLELHLPDLQVFTDARYTEAELVRRYFAALLRPEAFRSLDDAYRFDAVLFKLVDSGPVIVSLLGDARWRLVYGDLHRVLFARSGSPVVERWPVEPIRFYEGDDLSTRVNGLAAIQWTAILVQAQDRARLLEALAAFARAPRVPSYVIQYGLQYGLQLRDHEVFDAARALVPRMLALREGDRLAVTRLLRHTLDR